MQIGKFKIPSFELNEGDLLCLVLGGGAHFWGLEKRLVNLFSGKELHPSVKPFENIEFVKQVHQSKIRNMFFSLTVDQYYKKHGILNHKIQNQLFQIEGIERKTKINRLPGNLKKWLSLFCTLSQSNNIIFDLVGQDPLGARQTMKYVRQYVDEGGSAILLDNFDGNEPECTKYYKIEIAENFIS
ncbi:MAG: hypothetical protein F6K17_19660 [Okeania sp. SIO3C4]|nr:hypothetical protein [Okeania sp. SIO3C4]